MTIPQYIDLFDLTIKYIRIVRWIERPYHHSYHSLRKEMIMNIAIQSSGLVLTEGLRAYVHRRLQTSLGWALTRRLAVWLSDINGPRGGRDKRCKIQISLDHGKTIVIEDTEEDLYAAIDLAADRADRALAARWRAPASSRTTRLPPWRRRTKSPTTTTSVKPPSSEQDHDRNENIATAPMWAGFVAFVLLMLAVDLWIFGGNKHTRSAHAKRRLVARLVQPGAGV
jgi:ribosome-associated translation inhibitor RaiA